MIANMRAVLLLRSKEVFADGAILEMVLWRLPQPVAGSRHLYKYRLYYGIWTARKALTYLQA
jgi:hypothetical protein